MPADEDPCRRGCLWPKCQLYHLLGHARFSAIRLGRSSGNRADQKHRSDDMQRIGFIVMPQFQVMALAATTVFEMANFHAGEPLYEISLISEHGGLVPNSLGMMVDTTRWEDGGYDTLVIGSGVTVPAAS